MTNCGPPPADRSIDLSMHVLIDRIYLYGYSESSSHTRFTTKGTKDTKTESQYVLSFLRDLRVLRGEKTLDRIDWNFLDNRVQQY